MTVVRDPALDVMTSVTVCRSCRAQVYWSLTDRGKRAPFDVKDGQPTRINHFTTCPDARQWSMRKQKQA
jgi:hypothetical protein